MAAKNNAANSTCYIPVIENHIEIQYGEFCTIYIGTKEDLIAAAIAGESMFPTGGNLVISNLRPEVGLNERWITRNIKNGRFEICRWHERKSLPKPPAPWNPQAFRENIIRFIDTIQYALLQRITGNIEAEDHDGVATHRFAEADQQRIKQLHAQLIAVLQNARIEPAKAAQPLKLMEIGSQVRSQPVDLRKEY